MISSIINCLSLDVDIVQQVTSLLAQGRRLYVGTISGTVAVFDSQSFGLITNFTWHKGKVRTLLLLPEQVKSCVCVEVPFGVEEDKVTRERSRSHIKSSLQTNSCFVQNTNCNLSLVASIGNGRLKLVTESKTDTTENSSTRSSRRATTLSMSVMNEDINLLIWHS